jgi:hypothetical protein
MGRAGSISEGEEEYIQNKGDLRRRSDDNIKMDLREI